ncbi:MAG: hypothetical protein QNK05_22915 [Myxococcota bacterium]|nr:hypothetical protein [Myxococcota bacterium]
MRRWPILLLGLALAVGAGVTLLSSPDSSPDPGGPDDVAAAPPASEGPELHPEIDAASRRALTEVLRKTEGPE